MPLRRKKYAQHKAKVQDLKNRFPEYEQIPFCFEGCKYIVKGWNINGGGWVNSLKNTQTLSLGVLKFVNKRFFYVKYSPRLKCLIFILISVV